MIGQHCLSLLNGWRRERKDCAVKVLFMLGLYRVRFLNLLLIAPGYRWLFMELEGMIQLNNKRWCMERVAGWMGEADSEVFGLS